MKKEFNKNNILLLYFVILGITLFFSVFNKGSNNTVALKFYNNNEEIALGIDNCATEEEKCSRGSLNSSGKCEYTYTDTCSKTTCNSGSCTTTTWQCEKTGTEDPYTVCTKCNDGYESNGSGGCKGCAKGYAGTGGTCSACGDGKWSGGTATSCSSIKAGCYGSSGKSECPNKCDPGSFSLAGAATCTKCTGQGYQDESGQTSCKRCFGDVTDNQTKCNECKITSFSVVYSKPNYKEPGTNQVIVAQFEHCDKYSKVYKPSETFSTPDSCGTITASVTVSGDGGSDYKEKIINTKNAWKGNSTIVTKKALPSRLVANSTGANIYGICVRHEAGPPYWKCTNVQTRCGESVGSVEVPSYHYCCMDKEYMGISNATKWRSYWPKEDDCPNSLNYNIKQTKENEGKVNENTCVPYEVPNYCSPSKLKETSQNIEATQCEDSQSLIFNSQGSECVNGEKSFYKIKCSREVKADFDYGNDNDKNTVRELYGGQGFEFAINTKTTVECNATFNSDNWNEVFDKFIKKIDFIDFDGVLTSACRNGNKTAWKNRVDAMAARDKISNSTQRDVYELWNIIDDLRNIVIAYNKYTPPNDYDESNNLKLKYKLKNSQNEIEYPFLFDKVIDEGKYTITKTGSSQPVLHDTGVFSSNCYSGTVTELKEKCFPINYKITNASNPRIVNLFPEETILDKNTGEDIDSNADNTVNGGNKVYTQYDIVSGTMPVTMVLSGLAAESTITNDKCDVIIKDIELSYRPIDVGNPFINSKWEKGENWINEMYDFTKTIHKTTWSETTRNTINIPASEISVIKASNASYQKNNESPYLGICDKIKKERQDSITQKLCGLIK